MFKGRDVRGPGQPFLARLRGKPEVETEGLFSRPYTWSYRDGECSVVLPEQGEADVVPARESVKRRAPRRLWTRDDGFTLSGARKSRP